MLKVHFQIAIKIDFKYIGVNKNVLPYISVSLFTLLTKDIGETKICLALTVSPIKNYKKLLRINKVHKLKKGLLLLYKSAFNAQEPLNFFYSLICG